MSKDSTSHLKGTQCPKPLQSAPTVPGKPVPLAYQDLGNKPPKTGAR